MRSGLVCRQNRRTRIVWGVILDLDIPSPQMKTDETLSSPTKVQREAQGLINYVVQKSAKNQIRMGPNGPECSLGKYPYRSQVTE